MSKGKKTRKRKKLALSPSKEQTVNIVITPPNIQTRLNNITPLPSKKFLILCEGETEEAYFNGLKTNEILKKKLSALKIEVIAPSSKKGDTNGIIDNNLKGLIWEAMQRKKKAELQNSPYDEIWIVLDNDGRNSFRLTKSALGRIKQRINTQHFSILKAFENDYFLSELSFNSFLSVLFTPIIPDISLIIQLSEKLNLFEEYKDDDVKQLFYKNNTFNYGQKRNLSESDFDIHWKDYVQKAYSCRAFESWLLLHFEQCTIPFSTSGGVVTYLKSFAPLFEKGRGNRNKLKANAYDALKPNPFAEKYETLSKAQAALDKLETAIENGTWLQQRMLAIGKRDNLAYYELDPFTDVHFLLRSLLGKEEIITWSELGQVNDWNGLSITILFNRATQQATLSIENKTHSRILLNSTNIGNHLWVQGIKDYQRIPKIKATKFLQGLINLEVNQADNKVIQFPSFPNDNTIFYLHFSWNKEELIVPL